jgi:hypothetical protein
MEISIPSVQSLAERVASLEKQNRRIKKSGVAAIVLISAAVVMGQAPSNHVLEAGAFHLKDSAGRVRARLSMEDTDRPMLTLVDEKGFPVASLGERT